MNNTESRIEFTHQELCATIEALYDAIQSRARWSTQAPNPGSGAFHWQSLDFEVARDAIDLLVAAYSKAVLTLRSWPEEMVHPDFLSLFGLPTEVWDLLAEITNAKGWDNVPRHDPDREEDCPICVFLDS
jgi:hypothetical protein